MISVTRNTYCPSCSEKIGLDSDVSGDISCPNCTEPLEVSTKRAGEIDVRRIRPYIPENDISADAQSELEPVEWHSFHESSIAAGYGAYVAAEFMALRALEGISRRITGEEKWADAIDKLEDQYPDLSATIEYLKNERNKVAHADKVQSDNSEAMQTYQMTVRMVEEILGSDTT